YEALYNDSKMMIDASVGYFFCVEEVIRKVKEFGQFPKIVFLYREPRSRAASLFNELRKKGIEDAPDLESALKDAALRTDGLWWERYYDNVRYSDVFEALSNTFDVLPIEYRHFQASPQVAMN